MLCWLQSTLQEAEAHLQADKLVNVAFQLLMDEQTIVAIWVVNQCVVVHASLL